MRHPRRIILAAAVLALSACADGGPPPGPAPRPFDYTYLTQLKLDVAQVDVVEAFVPPRTPPNVDHRAPIEPRVALAQMARDRVQAWGSSGRATVTIRDASLIEERLPRQGGLTGLFGSQPSERYTLNLAIVLEVVNAGATTGTGGINGRAEARVTRMRTVNDDVTIAQRERIWDEMLRAAMDDPQGMNVEFEYQVRRALRTVLVPEGTPRGNPAAVEAQELAPPGSAPGSAPLAPPPPGAGPRELTPPTTLQVSPQAPTTLQPGPGGTPGMGTLGTLPVR